LKCARVPSPFSRSSAVCNTRDTATNFTAICQLRAVTIVGAVTPNLLAELNKVRVRSLQFTGASSTIRFRAGLSPTTRCNKSLRLCRAFSRIGETCGAKDGLPGDIFPSIGLPVIDPMATFAGLKAI
jgi:hypothetical protein